MGSYFLVYTFPEMKLVEVGVIIISFSVSGEDDVVSQDLKGKLILYHYAYRFNWYPRSTSINFTVSLTLQVEEASVRGTQEL